MPAPKGNKYGKNGGRPWKYTAEELKLKLEEYFKDKTNKPYSVLELCSFLHITPETLSNWTENPETELCQLAIDAKLKIAAGWEKGELAPALGIFLLKNHMKYKDKHEQELSGKDGGAIEIEYKWRDSE
jgi:hypothetical protein